MIKILIAVGLALLAGTASAQYTYEYPSYSPRLGIAVTPNGTTYVQPVVPYYTPQYYNYTPAPVYVVPAPGYYNRELRERYEWQSRRGHGPAQYSPYYHPYRR